MSLSLSVWFSSFMCLFFPYWVLEMGTFFPSHFGNLAGYPFFTQFGVLRRIPHFSTKLVLLPLQFWGGLWGSVLFPYIFWGSAMRVFFSSFSFGGCMGPVPATLGNPGRFSHPGTGLEGEPLLQELARRYVAAMGDMEGRKPGPSSMLGEQGPRIRGQAGGLREPHTPVSRQAPPSCGRESPRDIASPSTPEAPAAGPPCAAWPSASGGDTAGHLGTLGDGDVGIRAGGMWTGMWGCQNGGDRGDSGDTGWGNEGIRAGGVGTLKGWE